VLFIPKALDITNMQFGKLTAIKRVDNKGRKSYWLCKCSCENNTEFIVQTGHLTTGKITSCGCAKINKLIDDGIERTLICPICGVEFVTTNPSRVYCFECSPQNAKRADVLLAKKHAVKHKLIVYKGGKCEKCGYNKCEGALQFHHRNPAEKDFSIADVNLNGSTVSMQDLFAEVDKCDLLCANCHAELHSLN
jgi:hypothetical protein